MRVFCCVLLAVCACACTSPTAPQAVQQSETPVVTLPVSLPVFAPQHPASAPQRVSDCASPDALSDFLQTVVADAVRMTAETYGLVVYFEIETSGTQTHVFGELRRSHPRLQAVSMNYFVVPSLLDYPSSSALLSAMRSGLPETVEVRLVNQPLTVGCRPASAVKGRVEGSY